MFLNRIVAPVLDALDMGVAACTGWSSDGAVEYTVDYFEVCIPAFLDVF